MNEPNNASTPRVVLAGHPSSQPAKVASFLSLEGALVSEIDGSVNIADEITQADLFILCISAKSGVSQEMIEIWHYAADRQIPRAILVNGLEMSETDFDDIVLIANRVLEPVITPFLVLHDEVGEPVGLISLHDNQVHDYSTGALTVYEADSELLSLVAEFKEELEISTLEFDGDGFQAGLVVPALPIVESRKIGQREFQSYLSILTKR